MFNALRSEELLLGVGRVLRTVADAQGALEEYERSQVLSAYSVTRLLAAEQAAAPGLMRHTKVALLRVFDGPEQAGPEVERARRAVEAAESGVEIGDAVADLLAALPARCALRTEVHRVLADMVELEVEALAGARR